MMDQMLREITSETVWMCMDESESKMEGETYAEEIQGMQAHVLRCSFTSCVCVCVCVCVFSGMCQHVSVCVQGW